MFRKKNSNSEENLFNVDQKNVKTKINQNLAHTVKELQKEYPLSSSPVQSDSSLAQYLCSVLESAFIHGLKVSYFEKDAARSTSRNNFPKPQFWNLIIKISHAETVNRVQALTYITSRIGKCRAWLRLTLNDGLVTSYLASIFSKDQESVLSHYYDQHALFLDHEHADIFLRYLQGIESVIFDLSFNSSMLNLWTKTPLELAGLVPPSTTAPLYLGVQTSLENNNHTKSLTSKRPLVHRASAPALLKHSYSFPSSSAQKILDNKDSAVPEGNEENENDSADTVSITTDATPVATPTDDDVLHKRQLMKKKKRRKKLSYNEHGVRIMSSWSSLSSGESLTSGSNSSSRRNTPRSSSFCETPPTTVLTRKANEMTEKRLGSGLNERQIPEEVQRHSTPKKDTNKKLPSPLTTPSKERKNQNLVLPENNNAATTTAQQSETDSTDSEKFLSSGGAEDRNRNPQGGAEDSISTLEESTGSMSSSHVDSKLGSQMPLPNAYKLSYVTSSGSMSSEEESKVAQGRGVGGEGHAMTSEAIDIYATSFQHEAQIPQNGDLHLNLSTSRGLGNSLSMGGGWSSDQSAANTPDNPKMSRNNSGVLPLEVNEIAEIKFSFDPHERLKRTNSRPTFPTEKIVETTETDAPEVFIRREGYLKKMGAALKLWKKRWFVLRGTKIVYYKDKSSKDLLGTIDLLEVLTISDEANDEKADVVIIMNDGTKHYLAADDKKLTLDWASDFKQVISGPASSKESSGEHTTNGTSSPAGYLEEYEVISVRNHLLNGTKTSWHAAMIAHMSRIANEKGLDSQNYQCADCASPIGIIYGPPRLCTFTGQYYCAQCHANEESQIPARIIHNWDFRRHKVSKRSKSFLEQVFTDPLINLSESNPGIYKYIDEMGKLLQLREQLKNLKPYLQTCRRFDLDDINNRLGCRLYFLDDCHLYSVQDLCAVQEKTLGSMVSKVVAIGTKHIYGCPLCMAKGFLCEICKSSKVIFPFETDTTVQCYECKSVFHQGCKTDSVKCPKCERRQMRCLQSMEDLNEPSTSDSGNEN